MRLRAVAVRRQPWPSRSSPGRSPPIRAPPASAAKVQCHGPPPSWAAHAESVREAPDASHVEPRPRLGLISGPSAPWRAIKALGPTVKTVKKVLTAAQQDRAYVGKQRQRWRTEMSELDSRRLIFIDESWAKSNMSRRYGRTPRGQRLVLSQPHGHSKTTTSVAALQTDGLTAPTVVDGAINGDLFVA